MKRWLFDLVDRLSTPRALFTRTGVRAVARLALLAVGLAFSVASSAQESEWDQTLTTPDQQFGNQYGQSFSLRSLLGLVGAPATSTQGYTAANPAAQYYVAPAPQQDPALKVWPGVGEAAILQENGLGEWQTESMISAPLGGQGDVEQGLSTNQPPRFGYDVEVTDVSLTDSSLLVAAPGNLVTSFNPRFLTNNVRYLGQMHPSSYKARPFVGNVYSYKPDATTGEWTLQQIIVPQRYGTETKDDAYTPTTSANFGFSMASGSNWLAVSAPGKLEGTSYASGNRGVQLFEYLSAPVDARVCVADNSEIAWPRPEVVELTLEEVTGTFPFCPGGECGEGSSAKGNVSWPMPPFNLLRKGQITAWTPDAEDSTRGILDIYPLRDEAFYALPKADCTPGDTSYCTVTARDGLVPFPSVLGTGVVTAVRTLKAAPDYPCWVSAGELFDVGPVLPPGQSFSASAFGASIALSDDALVLVVGAPYYPQLPSANDPEPPTGAAYVYSRGSLADPFGPPTSLDLPPEIGFSPFGLFGMTVTLDEGRIAIGARLENCSVEVLGSDSSSGDSGSFCTDPDGEVAVGAVHFFEERTPGAGDWEYTTTVNSASDDANQLFGTSIALSGQDLFVGAPGTLVDGRVVAGAVQRFIDETGTSSWNWVETLFSPTPQDAGNLGFHLALDGTTLFVGSLNSGESVDGNGVRTSYATGEVYVRRDATAAVVPKEGASGVPEPGMPISALFALSSLSLLARRRRFQVG